MNFTFGIITAPAPVNKPELESQRIRYLEKIVASIEHLNIPGYEIIIIGECPTTGKNLSRYPFDENAYPPQHITKKKNQITEKAKYDNIVYLHDYIEICPDWYIGFEKFGEDWDICMTKMINLHGQRFRDWTLEPTAAMVSDSYSCLLPYDVTDLSYYQYISGAYWVAKKKVMQEFPLDERRHWGAAEDIEWSRRVNLKYKFCINEFSTVHLLKEKSVVFGPAQTIHINELRKRPKRGRFIWQDLNVE